MATFETVIKYSYTPEELQALSLYDEELEREELGSHDAAHIECDITRDRIRAFMIAHDVGYSNELYIVMKAAGFTPRYLSYLSHQALTQSGDSND